MILNLRSSQPLRNPRVCGVLCGLLLLVGATFLPPARAQSNISTRPAATGYARLLDFIEQEDLSAPLYVFREINPTFNQARHRENLKYFQQNKGVIARIKRTLNSSKIDWKLGRHIRRLLFVPELREEYATLYEAYCNDVVAFMVKRMDIGNPYRRIVTPSQPSEVAAESGDRTGVTVYLVHNVVDEYLEEYEFSNRSGEKVRIKLSNKKFTGLIGSYSSYLYIEDQGRFRFRKSSYTLWQNSSRNPYHALSTPVEETLHIVLRDYTQKAIRAELEASEPESSRDIEAVVDDWICVEEAVVGGILWELMQEIFDRYLPVPKDVSVDDLMHLRKKGNRYRLLEKGIEVIANLGLESAMNLYRRDPKAFEDLLQSGA